MYIAKHKQALNLTLNGKLITNWQCDSRIAYAEFLFTKRQYIQTENHQIPH